MKNKIMKLAAIALSVVTLSGTPVVTYAAPFAGACAVSGNESTQVASAAQTSTQSQNATADTAVSGLADETTTVAGITSTMSQIQSTGTSDVAEIQAAEAQTAAEEAQADAQAASDSNAKAAAADVVNNSTSVVTAEFNDVAIANVESYVNVRSAASEDSEPVGKLYTNCMASVEGVEGDWYKITSGNCTGYIKGEYLIVGDANVAKQAGRRVATVNTETLKVRTAPSTDAEILGLVPNGEDLTVTDESITGWVKVSIEEGEGYVSTDYVGLSTEYKYGETVEEEQARLAAEEAERQQAAAAAAAAAEKEKSTKGKDKDKSSSKESGSSKSYSSPSGGGGSSVAGYACQFVGNPYVYGGTSLTNGADCSGFTMRIFEHFGVSTGRTSRDQASNGKQISLSEIQPGDLLFYASGKTINHVALYIGDGKIIHASTSKTGIIISNAYYRTPAKAVTFLN